MVLYTSLQLSPTLHLLHLISDFCATVVYGLSPYTYFSVVATSKFNM